MTQIDHQLTMLDDEYIGSIKLLSLILWIVVVFQRKIYLGGGKYSFPVAKELRLIFFFLTHSQTSRKDWPASFLDSSSWPMPHATHAKLATVVKASSQAPSPPCPWTYGFFCQQSLYRPLDTLFGPTSKGPFPETLPISLKLSLALLLSLEHVYSLSYFA